MNRAQRWILIVGLLLVFLAGLFPPATVRYVWGKDNIDSPDGRGFLFWTDNPPNAKQYIQSWSYRLWLHLRSRVKWSEYGVTQARGYRRIDLYRLGIELLGIATLTGAAFLIAHRRRS